LQVTFGERQHVGDNMSWLLPEPTTTSLRDYVHAHLGTSNNNKGGRESAGASGGDVLGAPVCGADSARGSTTCATQYPTFMPWPGDACSA
jgi:hypothetical protein